MRFEAAISIDATPQRVWEVFSDVERWPEWTTTVTSAELLTPGPLAVGSRARLRQPKIRVTVWTVTELVEGSHFVWESKAPGVRTVAGHYVEAEGSGARAISRLDQLGIGGALFGRLYAGLTNRYLAIEAAGLKERSER
jgi:uncharacterized membrane protein